MSKKIFFYKKIKGKEERFGFFLNLTILFFDFLSFHICLSWNLKKNWKCESNFFGKSFVKKTKNKIELVFFGQKLLVF